MVKFVLNYFYKCIQCQKKKVESVSNIRKIENVPMHWNPAPLILIVKISEQNVFQI